MLVFATDQDLYDKCHIILEFCCQATLTSRSHTTTATQNIVLKPQGSALCKQTAMSHMWYPNFVSWCSILDCSRIVPQ